MQPDATGSQATATDVAAIVHALVAGAQLESVVEPHLDQLLGALDVGMELREPRELDAARRLLANDIGWLLAAYEPDVAAATRRRARLLEAGADLSAAAHAWLDAADLACALQLHDAAAADIDAAHGLLEALSEPDAIVRIAASAAKVGHPRAGACWQRAAQVLADDGCADRAAHALHEAWWASDAAGSVELLRQAARIAHERGWGARAAFVLTFVEGRLEDAHRHAQQALDDARSNRDRALEALALHGMACVRSVSGDIADAIAMQRQAIAVAHAVGDARTIDSGGINLVAMLEDDLRGDEALEALSMLQTQRDVAGTPGQRAEAAMLRAALLHGRGRLEEADALLLETLDDPASNSCEPLAAAHGRLFRLALDADLGIDDLAFAAAASSLRETALALGVGSLSTRVAFVEATRSADAGDDAAATALLLGIDVADADLLGAENAIRLIRTGLGARDRGALDRAATLLKACACTARMVAVARRELDAARQLLDSGDAGAARIVAAEWQRRGRPLDGARLLVAAARAAGRGSERARLAAEARELVIPTGARSLLACIERLAAPDAATAESLAPLATNSLFDAVDAQVRDALVAAAVEVRRPAGAVLHDADDELDIVWLLRSGSVRLSTVTDDERQLTVELLDASATIGEQALLGQRRAGTRAHCDTPVVLAALPVARVRDAIARCPRLGENVLALAGARLQRSRQLAERVAFWSVDRRLARCLLELDERYGRPTLDGHRVIDRTFTHFQVAELVNARRETVGEFLKRMRAAGVLEQRRRRIVVVDHDALQRIVADCS